MHSFKRFILSSVLLTLVCALCAGGAWAQQTAGSLHGQVVDEFGGLIVGATITVVNESGAEKSAVTDNDGNYVVNGLAPGKYIVRAIAPGFALFENTETEITAGQRAQLKITLAVSLEKEEVNVASENPVSTEPENNAGALVLRGADLESLPDDPDELAAALQALAGPSAGPNGGQFFIDGFTGGRLPPKESIREIRINQNPFSAEYDRLGFGRVEILTKPGTDKLRGSAFLNFNDESLNSRNPFASTRAPFQTRQYGGNLSGPVIAKKASFFLDFERREIDDNAVVNALVLDPLNPVAPAVPFNAVVLTPARRTTFSPRFDYQLNASNTLVARYTYSRNKQENSGVGNFSLPSRAFDTGFTEHTFQVTETAVLTPTIINETRFQYIRRRTESDGDNTVPTIIVNDAFTGGGSQVGLSFNNENRWELQNNTSWVMGRHSLKAGGRVRGVNILDFSQNNFGGTYFFNTLEQYRQTLLGTQFARPTQLIISGGDPQASVSQIDFGGYIQDDWRVRPNLTLSAGLRYETQSNIKSNLNFAPRIAFAWSPGAGGARQPKTVVRGGVGVFYDRFNESLTLQANRFNGGADSSQQFIVSNATPVGIDILNQYPLIPTLAQLQILGQPQTIRLVADDLQAPYTMQAAVSVERQLPYRVTLATTFISSRTLHVLRSRNINTPLPGTFTGVPGSGVRPLGNVNNYYEYESSGRLNQNQLVVSVNNRLNPNFTLFATYVLGKVSGDTDGPQTFPANTYDLSTEYGRASFDVRHRVFVGGSFGVPWGIRLSPFINASSGRPFNITTGLGDRNGDAQFTERPSFAPVGADCSAVNIRCTRFGNFNLLPAPGEEIIPRNFGEGPAFFAVNLRASKTFGFGEVKRSNNAANGQQGGGGARGGGGGGARGGGGGGGGARGGAGGGGGRGGGGPIGAASLFGNGGGNSAAEKRYNLTFSVQVQNIFNRNNQGQPIGNLSSPFFGQATSSAGSFGFGGGSTAANRRVEAQIRFTF
ncbi:MAG: TonB-dependent receptor [Acidobacteria bacterium]|nr:TonB-dependent receptor [Acidobacteriota bacterium]